jgi:hypothetical protein
MKPRVKPQESGSEERFRSKLKNIINLGHELVRLSELIDWSRLENAFCVVRQRGGTAGSAGALGGGVASAEAHRGIIG